MSFFWFQVALSVTLSVALSVVDGTLLAYPTTQEGQFPYQALIIHSNSNFSGALISVQHVLTTARAVKSLEQGLVILGAAGSYDTDELFEPKLKFEISQTNVIVHEKFDNDTSRNNIALITLPQAAETTAYVGPVKIPGNIDGDDFFHQGDASISYVARLERLEDSPTRIYILYDEVRILNQETCRGYFEITGDQAFCSEVDFFHMAYLSEGGPVVLKDRDDKIIGLVGLTSYATRNIDSIDPIPLTPVWKFTGWINERMHLDV